MTISRPRAASAFARAVIAASACERRPRSTGIISAFAAHQPKNGIHFSSRLRM